MSIVINKSHNSGIGSIRLCNRNVTRDNNVLLSTPHPLYLNRIPLHRMTRMVPFSVYVINNNVLNNNTGEESHSHKKELYLNFNNKKFAMLPFVCVAFLARCVQASIIIKQSLYPYIHT